jgi:hypothetical protein
MIAQLMCDKLALESKVERLETRLSEVVIKHDEEIKEIREVLGMVVGQLQAMKKT